MWRSNIDGRTEITTSYPSLAAELVRRNVAVIATINTPTILAAKGATKTIPIVFAVGVDPVKFGLVESLNRPGGNLTGLTQLNIEMEAKRVQLLHELAPSAKSIALLINPTSPAYSEAATASAQGAAHVLGVRLLVLNANTQSGIEAAFLALADEGARLLLVSGDSFLVAQRDQLVALAARHAMPALYHRREFAAVGGLMSYGPNSFGGVSSRRRLHRPYLKRGEACRYAGAPSKYPQDRKGAWLDTS